MRARLLHSGTVRGGGVAGPIIRKATSRRAEDDEPPAGAAAAAPLVDAPRARRPDPSQEYVIGAPITARLVVEAGPGHGKTDVACARVAHLIGGGIPPARILLISFTRTAVREMRNRIGELARAGVDVRGVVIRTLDSFAWRLRTGESEQGKGGPPVGYEQSIEAAVQMLGAPSEDLDSYLHSFRYVLVDEAQDLVGARAELVIRLLNRVRPDGGWVVFCDPAQAIYGWENGDGAAVDGFASQLDKLEGEVEKRVLDVLYRTARPELKRLLTATREIVTDPRVKGKADKVRECLLELAPEEDSSFDQLRDLVKEYGTTVPSTFVLFRTRGGAQLMSSYLATAGVPHRLRFGGLSGPTSPWVAHLVNAVGKRELSRQDFDLVWSANGVSWLYRGWEADEAWIALRRMGAKPGTKNVDVSLVAQRLSAGSLPDELCLKDVGQDGPVVGTIHGSKGREADHVIACVQASGWDGEDQEAEARVQYVGLSRARHVLTVRRLGTVYWRATLDSGRWWRGTKDLVQLQLGLPGDVEILGSLSASTNGPEALQRSLSRFDGRAVHASVEAAKEHNWARRIVLEPGAGIDAIGTLSREGSLNKDLWEIAKSWGRNVRPPNKLYHAWWVDLTSVAIHADHPAVQTLPSPWRETRIWLCPVMVGMCSMYKPGGGFR